MIPVFFERRVELYPSVWEYYFRPARPLQFLPGQYVSLLLKGVADDARGTSRTLTITSLPSDELLSFTVKIPTPCSTYKQVLATIEPGTEAAVGDALGDLVLPKDPTQPLVFIAGGMGIASFVSMLKHLIATKEEREIYLFYSLKSREHQLYRELITSYPLALKTITISPNRLTIDDITSSTPPHGLFYVSGSQPFVEHICKGLVEAGISRSQLIFDYFDGYPEL